MTQLGPIGHAAVADLEATGWTIWEAGPGRQNMSLPSHVGLLDIQIGGSATEYLLVETLDRGQSQASRTVSLPNSFSLLPSGRLRQIRTNRTGGAMRVIFTDSALQSKLGSRAAFDRPLLHVTDPSVIDAAAAFAAGRVDPSSDGCPRNEIELFLTLLVTRVAYLAHTMDAEGGSSQPKPVERAITYVEGHLSEPLPLEKVARVAGVSPFHFARLFRASVGQSFHDYLLGRRIEMAERLIRQTNSALANIAYKAGFASQSHMTTVFRRRTGRTPGALRRSKRASVLAGVS